MKMKGIDQRKNCLFCNKDFIFTPGHPHQIYCSKKCRQRGVYHKSIDKYRAAGRRYYAKNIERSRLNARNNYKKNRKNILKNVKRLRLKNINKWISRTTTREVLNYQGTKKKLIIKMELRCKNCNSKEALQIHHEVYPQKRAEIRDAINNGSIYYLCTPCHSKSHRRDKDE